MAKKKASSVWAGEGKREAQVGHVSPLHHVARIPNEGTMGKPRFAGTDSELPIDTKQRSHLYSSAFSRKNALSACRSTAQVAPSPRHDRDKPKSTRLKELKRAELRAPSRYRAS